MLIGVYMSIPLLKKIVDGGLSLYILCFWLCTSVALFGFDTLLKSSRFHLLMNNVFVFPFAVQYIGYFVLGHYLYTETILSKNIRRLIYTLGIIGLLCIIIGTAWLSRKSGQLSVYFYDYHNIMVVFVASALFTLFRYSSFSWIINRPKLVSCIKLGSNLTLGIYLIHVFILGRIYTLLLPYEWHAIISIPFIGLLTTLISFVISLILYRIPYLNLIVK